MALGKDGRVYTWGRNDEGQCGVGDLYGDWRKQKAENDAKEAQESKEEEKGPEIKSDISIQGSEIPSMLDKPSNQAIQSENNNAAKSEEGINEHMLVNETLHPYS